MGMFDSVYFTCPKCNESLEVQSKADDCLLMTYTPDSVPKAIAKDINGETFACTWCGTELKVVKSKKVKTVKMKIIELDKEDTGDLL